MTTISTAVPAVTFSTTGLDVPDEGDILAGRIADIGSAFGTAMSTNLKTPQGQLAVTDTAIIADKNDQLLAIVNNMNPDFSSGRFQDGIGRIYFLDRIAAAGTVVTATCSGVPGRKRRASVVGDAVVGAGAACAGVAACAASCAIAGPA